MRACGLRERAGSGNVFLFTRQGNKLRGFASARFVSRLIVGANFKRPPVNFEHPLRRFPVRLALVLSFLVLSSTVFASLHNATPLRQARVHVKILKSKMSYRPIGITQETVCELDGVLPVFDVPKADESQDLPNLPACKSTVGNHEVDVVFSGSMTMAPAQGTEAASKMATGILNISGVDVFFAAAAGSEDLGVKTLKLMLNGSASRDPVTRAEETFTAYVTFRDGE